MTPVRLEPFGLESSALPLSHCAPDNNIVLLRIEIINFSYPETVLLYTHNICFDLEKRIHLINFLLGRVPLQNTA